MKILCQMVGISKQALHQHRDAVAVRRIQADSLIGQADEIRAVHPKMGCRKLYQMLKPEHIGRDKCEALLLREGFKVRYSPNYRRTTYSQYKERYPNLIQGLELTGVNQVWQTDITYFYVNERHYYLTFIIDVYSRKIVGYHAADHMRAEANIAALQMALASRKGQDMSKLIHHSDRGGQYIDKEYLKILKDNGIKISMCEYAYQNAYTERVNGVIKNEYLKHKTISSYEQLTKQLKCVIRLYNEHRPHGNLLNKLTPVYFEEYILSLNAQQRPKMKIYTEAQQVQ
jgi:putative transposase